MDRYMYSTCNIYSMVRVPVAHTCWKCTNLLLWDDIEHVEKHPNYSYNHYFAFSQTLSMYLNEIINKHFSNISAFQQYRVDARTFFFLWLVLLECHNFQFNNRFVHGCGGLISFFPLSLSARLSLCLCVCVSRYIKEIWSHRKSASV